MDVINIILGIIGGIGGIQGIRYAYLMLNRKKGKFSWKDVEKGTKLLILKIRESGFTPDVIIGLGRGGSIVGAMISGNMGIVPFFSMDRKYQWKEGTREVVITSSFKEEMMKEKKVLLVLAFPYTGETLRKGREYLISSGASEVKTASLVKTEMSSIVSDFYVYEIKEVTKEPWRLMPEYRFDSLRK